MLIDRTAPPTMLALAQAADPALIAGLRAQMSADQWARASTMWRCTARLQQLPPPGDWRVWMLLAGRGFGKTRAGAEWVDALARANPGCSIALVGASHHDVRSVMVEGESGILSLPGHGARPLYNPALRRLTWPGGSIARCYSAAEPESLRGPQHHFAWADEVARWGAQAARGTNQALAAWDNLMMGTRMGACPRVLATTTPRALPIIRTLLARTDTVITGGSTLANAPNLPPAFIDAMLATYGDSMLGRQEIGGELISDVPGALWTRAMLETCRMEGDAREAMLNDEDALTRVAIGVDPPAGQEGDACGIIVAGLLTDGTVAVLADCSVEKASPARWAAAVADAAQRWRADRIVAEANMGGEMVRSVLHAADATLPVAMAHATRSKVARAEPIALHYAQGRVRHLGSFARLEDELCGLMAGGGYAGPGRSPDRADALVWAVSELMMRSDGGPTIRIL
jgi:phage terminase large subunit-like protein